MRDARSCAGQILIWLCLVSAVLLIPGVVLAEDIKFDGTYVVASNGDVAVTAKLTCPMIIYQKLRDSVSNLYLVLRELSSSRADTEVVDKKADWDDSNRSMTFSMKLLGAGRNLGNHWELDIPKGTEFINLDEAKHTFYFNESSNAGSLAAIRGTSKLILPAEARQFKWEDSRRVVTYVLPPVKAPSARNPILLIAGGALAVLGLVLTTVSFFVKIGSA
jgi:hypothetical protein